MPTPTVRLRCLASLDTRCRYAEEERTRGRPLTAVERRRLRKQHPPPPELGAQSEWPNAGAARAAATAQQ